MKTPVDKSVTFVFRSHPTKDLSWRWTARLVFPAGATAETLLPIELQDGLGRPIANAEFEFAGCRLQIRDGKTQISYADFVRGKHEVPLWLHRQGIDSIPGGLTFG